MRKSVLGLLVMFILTGCMNEGFQNKKIAQMESKLKLEMMVSTHPLWPYQENWLVYNYLEEAMNIDITVQTPDGDYSTAVNLSISSGDMPDLMQVPNLNTANKYGTHGSFINIFDYMELLPNYKKFLDQHPKFKQSILSASGESYFFPLSGLEQQTRRSWIYREDVFEKHGLLPPNDYDELYNVAKTLKQLYPNSFPIAVFGNERVIYNIVGNFNTWGAQYYDVNQKMWRFPPIEDNYKIMIEYMHKFYSEGLIAPNYMSMERKQFTDQFAQNKGFISPDYIGSIDEITSLIKKDIPQFSMAFMPPPAGGENGVQQNAYKLYLSSGFAIAKNAPNLEAALKYIDFLYSDEGVQLVSWGKESETFEMKNDAKLIKAEYASFADLRTKTGIATYGAYTVLDMNAFHGLYSENLQYGYEQIVDYETLPQPELAFTNDELEVLSIIGERVYRYRNENVAMFILGQRSLDEWDEYVEEMKRLGVQDVLDVYTTAYNRSLNYIK